MTLDLWLAFAATYTLISLIPGPSVLMVTSRAVSHGRASALWCVLGDLAGGVAIIALALLGVGAILSASAALFQIVKWAGVAYMTYLGLRLILGAGVDAREGVGGAPSGRSNLMAGFLVGTLNPKAIVFYVAFLSQFLDPAGDPWLQFAILATTSTVIVGVVLSAYALLAAQARTVLSSPRARRRADCASGGALIGGGLLMATR